MAATWEITITPVNLAKREMSVTGTRIAEDLDERVYRIPSFIWRENVAGSVLKAEAADQLEALTNDDKSRDLRIDDMIPGAEVALAEEMEARESA